MEIKIIAFVWCKRLHGCMVSMEVANVPGSRNHNNCARSDRKLDMNDV